MKCNFNNFGTFNKLESRREPYHIIKKECTLLNPHGERALDFVADKTHTYKSTDPRLYDIPRNTQMTLDRPPADGQIFPENIHGNKTLENHKVRSYTNYADINSGQIVYYTDPRVSVPFVRDIYTDQSNEYSILYKNPMDVVSTIYMKQPIEKPDYFNTTKSGAFYRGGLSWIQDSCSFREDIISRQQIKNNSQKYMGSFR